MPDLNLTVPDYPYGAPCWVDLLVGDVERAQSFYSDLFGWRWLAGDVLRLPAPGLAAAGYAPLARLFAGMVGATDTRVRADLAELPGKLDRVDELIAAGTIGGPEPNAADFQIGTSVRVLFAFEDLHGQIEGRPASELAMRLLPDFPGPIPPALPT